MKEEESQVSAFVEELKRNSSKQVVAEHAPHQDHMGETGSNQLFSKVESLNIPLGTERIKRLGNRSFGESSISLAGLENKKVSGDESMSMVSLLDQLEDKNSKPRGVQPHYDLNQS